MTLHVCICYEPKGSSFFLLFLDLWIDISYTVLHQLHI